LLHVDEAQALHGRARRPRALLEVSDWMCFVFDDYQQSIRKK